MELITSKRVVGVHHDPTKFFTIRVVHTEGMQEFLCSDCKEKYEKKERQKKNSLSLQADAFINRLAADSEEQLRYNAVINSIVNYKDHNEYKYKTSFKYKVMKFLKLTK